MAKRRSGEVPSILASARFRMTTALRSFISLRLVRCEAASLSASKSFQFFIVTNTTGSHHLDGKHAIFGKVVKGMNVAVAISKVAKDGNDKPISAVVMNKVYVKD